MKNTVKLEGSVQITALILLIVMIACVGGVLVLFRIERSMAKRNATTSTDAKSTVAVISATPGATAGSGITAFQDRLKAVFDSYKTDTKKRTTPSKKSGGGSVAKPSSNEQTDPISVDGWEGIGGVGQSGVLDTDVPWREEGESDLDYSYKEVRACGAAVKEPPTQAIGTTEFEQAYHDYLAWIDADCRAAYDEAGKDYPF